MSFFRGDIWQVCEALIVNGAKRFCVQIYIHIYIDCGNTTIRLTAVRESGVSLLLSRPNGGPETPLNNTDIVVSEGFKKASPPLRRGM